MLVVNDRKDKQLNVVKIAALVCVELFVFIVSLIWLYTFCEAIYLTYFVN